MMIQNVSEKHNVTELLDGSYLSPCTAAVLMFLQPPLSLLLDF